jgi:hypothetical protein
MSALMMLPVTTARRTLRRNRPRPIRRLLAKRTSAAGSAMELPTMLTWTFPCVPPVKMLPVMTKRSAAPLPVGSKSMC